MAEEEVVTSAADAESKPPQPLAETADVLLSLVDWNREYGCQSMIVSINSIVVCMTRRDSGGSRGSGGSDEHRRDLIVMVELVLTVS